MTTTRNLTADELTDLAQHIAYQLIGEGVDADEAAKAAATAVLNYAGKVASR